jgi:hypothetical protein
MYFIIKTFLTAIIIAIVSELSRRFTFISALLISLPLVSILSFCWIYYEGRDVQKIIDMSYSVFWLVLPSLLFFLLLPVLLKSGMRFSIAMVIACMGMSLIYGIGIAAWRYFKG